MRTYVVAKVILADRQSRILLLQRSESDVRRPLEWDLPGGHVDADEYFEQAAVRETQEEAGIVLKIDDLILAGTDSQRVQDDLMVHWLFFVAHTADTDVKLSHEHVDYKWVNLQDAHQQIQYERQKQVLRNVIDNNLLDAAYDR